MLLASDESWVALETIQSSYEAADDQRTLNGMYCQNIHQHLLTHNFVRKMYDVRVKQVEKYGWEKIGESGAL